MSQELYIGIMSGTSLDGVDLALCQIDEKSCTLLSSYTYNIPVSLEADILYTIKNSSTIEKIGNLDHSLGNWFAKATLNFIEIENINPKNIKAIGLHGQTLWHKPDGDNPFSMQLGDPNIITAKTDITVVSDFRRKDLALGGQGAPFAPAFHQFLFHNDCSTSIVNIGGMANITILGDKLIGYDTGCGNVLMDMWINMNIENTHYDESGEWARSGEIDKNLLNEMLEDEYFSMDYPKSTGREKFNYNWLESYIVTKALKPQDIQRTLLELTAITIVNEIMKFDTQKMILCGGGARNILLVERLKSLLPNIEISTAQNSDMLEAMAFAWLAYKRIHKEKVNLKDVTGARENSILGGVYE